MLRRLAFALAIALLAGCSSGAPPNKLPGGSDAGGDAPSGPAPLRLSVAKVPSQSLKRASMKTPRDGHTSTVLANGKVLVIGGERISTRAMLTSVELYDPDADSWATLAPLPEGRGMHTATLLADGKVLIVGGGKANAIGVPSGAEVRTDALLYDPETGDVKSLGPNKVARHGHQAVRLPSGKVLIAGGGGSGSTVKPAQGAGNPQPFGDALADAEVYDPSTQAFATVGSLAQARYSFTMVPLADGRVLASGGAAYDPDPRSFASSEVFDEKTSRFVAAASFDGLDRLFHVATPLEDGRVLVFGGKKSNTAFLSDLQLYDPATDAWKSVGAAPPERTVATLAPLEGGGALVFGGLSCDWNGCQAPRSVQIWSPDGASHKGPDLATGRVFCGASVLPDGSVLVTGGYGDTGDSTNAVESLTP